MTRRRVIQSEISTGLASPDQQDRQRAHREEINRRKKKRADEKAQARQRLETRRQPVHQSENTIGTLGTPDQQDRRREHRTKEILATPAYLKRRWLADVRDQRKAGGPPGWDAGLPKPKMPPIADLRAMYSPAAERQAARETSSFETSHELTGPNHTYAGPEEWTPEGRARRAATRASWSPQQQAAAKKAGLETIFDRQRKTQEQDSRAANLAVAFFPLGGTELAAGRITLKAVLPKIARYIVKHPVKTAGRVSAAAALPHPKTAAKLLQGKPLTEGEQEQMGFDLGGVPGNALSDVSTMTMGFPAGVAKLIKDPKQTASDVKKSYEHTYGPAAHGDFGETLHRIGEHPVGPALDLSMAGSLAGKIGLKTTRVVTRGKAGNVPRERFVHFERGKVQPWASPNETIRFFQHKFDRYSEGAKLEAKAKKAEEAGHDELAQRYRDQARGRREMPVVGARSRVVRRLPFEREREHERTAYKGFDLERERKHFMGKPAKQFAYDVLASYGDRALERLQAEIKFRQERKKTAQTTSERVAQTAQILMLRRAEKHLEKPDKHLARAIVHGRDLTEHSQGAKLALGELSPESAAAAIDRRSRIVTGGKFEDVLQFTGLKPGKLTAGHAGTRAAIGSLDRMTMLERELAKTERAFNEAKAAKRPRTEIEARGRAQILNEELVDDFKDFVHEHFPEAGFKAFGDAREQLQRNKTNWLIRELDAGRRHKGAARAVRQGYYRQTAKGEQLQEFANEFFSRPQTKAKLDEVERLEQGLEEAATRRRGTAKGPEPEFPWDEAPAAVRGQPRRLSDEEQRQLFGEERAGGHEKIGARAQLLRELHAREQRRWDQRRHPVAQEVVRVHEKTGYKELRGGHPAGEGAFFMPDVSKRPIHSLMGRVASVLGRPQKSRWQHQNLGKVFGEGRLRRGPNVTIAEFHLTRRRASRLADAMVAKGFAKPLNRESPTWRDPDHVFFNPNGAKLPRAVAEEDPRQAILGLTPQELIADGLVPEHDLVRVMFPTEREVKRLDLAEQRGVMQVHKSIAESLIEQQRGRYRDALLQVLDIGNNVTRLGFLYLKPSFIPANFVGNVGFLAIHQGAWTPWNLRRSIERLSDLEPETLRRLDLEVGTGASMALLEGEGPLSRYTRGIAHFSNIASDRMPRRAAIIHELGKRGYKTDREITGLLNDRAKRHVLNQIGESAENSMVRFRGLRRAERDYLSRIIFIYPWMKGATRYGWQLGVHHPFKARMVALLGEQGWDEMQKKLKGVASYLQTLMPAGEAHKKLGTTVVPVRSPLSITPIGTFGEVVQTAAGLTKGKVPSTQRPGRYMQPSLRAGIEAAFGVNLARGYEYQEETPFDIFTKTTVSQFPALRALKTWRREPQTEPFTGSPAKQRLYVQQGGAKAALAEAFLGGMRKRELNLPAAQAKGHTERRSMMSRKERVLDDDKRFRRELVEASIAAKLPHMRGGKYELEPHLREALGWLTKRNLNRVEAREKKGDSLTAFEKFKADSELLRASKKITDRQFALGVHRAQNASDARVGKMIDQIGFWYFKRGYIDMALDALRQRGRDVKRPSLAGS